MDGHRKNRYRPKGQEDGVSTGNYSKYSCCCSLLCCFEFLLVFVSVVVGFGGAMKKGSLE